MGPAIGFGDRGDAMGAARAMFHEVRRWRWDCIPFSVERRECEPGGWERIVEGCDGGSSGPDRGMRAIDGGFPQRRRERLGWEWNEAQIGAGVDFSHGRYRRRWRAMTCVQ